MRSFEALVTYSGILPQGPVCILPYEIQVGAGTEKVNDVFIQVRSRGVLQIPVYHTNPQLSGKKKH